MECHVGRGSCGACAGCWRQVRETADAIAIHRTTDALFLAMGVCRDTCRCSDTGAHAHAQARGAADPQMPRRWRGHVPAPCVCRRPGRTGVGGRCGASRTPACGPDRGDPARTAGAQTCTGRATRAAAPPPPFTHAAPRRCRAEATRAGTARRSHLAASSAAGLRNRPTPARDGVYQGRDQTQLRAEPAHGRPRLPRVPLSGRLLRACVAPAGTSGSAPAHRRQAGSSDHWPRCLRWGASRSGQSPPWRSGRARSCRPALKPPPANGVPVESTV